MISPRDLVDALINALISALSTLTRKPKIAERPSQTPQILQMPQKRIFVIFMDYRNLVSDLPNSAKKFSNLSWLIDPILKCGIISFAYVFIPDNCTKNIEIFQLGNKHGFWPILCTRRIEGAIMKDKDTVDARMDTKARSMIVHTDVTDIVIISGDADFQDLANFARYHQKKVTVISTARARSGRFLEMAEAGSIELKIIE